MPGDGTIEGTTDEAISGHPADAPPAAVAAPVETHRAPRPGQLTDGWRWAFAVGWALLVPALIAVADAAHALGKPPWWMDAGGEVAWWTPVIMIAPLVPAIAGATNWRHWPCAGAFGVVALGLTAWVDWSETPGIARAEALLALAGLATTLAAFAGRVRAPAS
jgi:hypothetical protein